MELVHQISDVVSQKQLRKAMYSLVIEFYNLIAVLLQVVQMFDFILVALYCLCISLLQVHIFHSKQLLFVIQDLVDLETEDIRQTATVKN